MAHYGILREYRFEGVDDVRGAEVYGVNSEKLGTIDDVIFDHSTGEIRYVIIKTGGLLSRKKVMVPAHSVELYGNHEDKFYVGLDKERLEMLPEFNEGALRSEGDWENYIKAYEQCISEDPVLYNKCTGRIITPPHEEESQPPGGKPLTAEAADSGRASVVGKKDVEFHRGVPQREVMSPIGSEIEIPQEQSAASIPEAMREPGVYKLDRTPQAENKPGRQDTMQANYGRRWIGFQQRLREGRDKVVSGCTLCGTQDKAA